VKTRVETWKGVGKVKVVRYRDGRIKSWELLRKITKADIEKAKQRHAKRSKRARTLDERRTARRLAKRVETWMRRPGRYDHPGVDTAKKPAKTRKKTRRPRLVKVRYKTRRAGSKWGSWVAVLKVNRKGEVERVFRPVERIGRYDFEYEDRLPVGTVLEIAEGGSWRNKYRWYGVVTSSGEIKPITDITEYGTYGREAKRKVLQFLGAKRFAPPKKK